MRASKDRAMVRNVFRIALCVPLSLAFLASAYGSDYASYAAILQKTFEHQLHTLSPRIQSHYARRLYRLTGAPKYLPASAFDMYIAADRLFFVADRLGDAAYIADYVARLRERQPTSYKGNLRRQSLAPDGDFIFYLSAVLAKMHRLDGFGLQSVKHKALVAALKGFDFPKYLLNKQIIVAWAAQAPNWVYWLAQLEIIDLRREFTAAFRAAFPPEEILRREAYENMIYGMTHFILSASRYYQQAVNPEEFGWIFDHFTENIDKILRGTKPDVIAEVGIAFLLTGQEKHPVVRKCRDLIVRSIDLEHGMIPSAKGDFSLSKGEHRNVLAYMLLNWTDRLHPGPYFHRQEAVRVYAPKSVQVR